MPPISFRPQPVRVRIAQPQQTRVGMNPEIFTPGGKLSVSGGKQPYTGGSNVEVVTNTPSGLRSAAPTNSSGLGFIPGLRDISKTGIDFIDDSAEKAGAYLGRKLGEGIKSVFSGNKETTISDPRDSGTFQPATPRTRSQPQTQPQTQPQVQSPVGREDPFAPILEFEEPYSPAPAPMPMSSPAPISAPFKPKPIPKPEPRKAIDFEANPGTGTITLAPIDPKKGKPLATPSLLDEVEKGGINLLTPIVDFLKKLDTDIQQIKLNLVNLEESQIDFSPLLEKIAKMIDPILETITAIPESYHPEIVKPITEGMVELLTPIANLTATSIEVSSKVPRTTSETVAEFVAPIFLLITLLGTALDGIGKAISGLTLKTGIQIPQGLGVAAQIPMGMGVAAQIPMGMAASAQIPMGMGVAAQIPMGMAASAQIPMGMAASAQIPMSMGVAAQIPQTQTVLAELPQTITAAADLTAVDIEIQNLQKTLAKHKDDIDKCCRDIQDRLKKKKKDDDDRFPEFKSDGLIECDGATIPYSYAGEGLKGLHQQQNIILGISKMMLKKVCDNEIEFPLIQGGGTFVCDETFGNYNYSGIGLLGLQSQLDRVLDFNKKILSEVCDIEVPSFSFPEIYGNGTYICNGSITSYEYSGSGLIGLSHQLEELTKVNTKILAEVCEEEKIGGQIDFLDCDGNTQVFLYSGDGLLGLSNQVDALTKVSKLTYSKACETPTFIPVQPSDEFAEFDVPRQLVLTWGENYPYQTGSLWHTQIPNPREDLEWCRDFDNLIFTKGNIYGRWIWGGSKIRSGMRCVTDDEADRILDLIGLLSTSTGKKRFTIGGGVKLNPAVRQVRCVRAAIAQLNAEGLAEVVQCFVPPSGGC